MDIDKIIKEFAEKYGFIQQIDIERVEQLDFDPKNYNNINNKKFICLKDKNLIALGKINIEIDSIDEQEWYWINDDYYFFINILDFAKEENLIEAIIKECKNYKLI